MTRLYVYILGAVFCLLCWATIFYLIGVFEWVK